MQGYQVTFFTEEGRRHGREPMHEWLVAQARALGIGGVTVNAGMQGVGRDGRLHSAHFVELADRPLAVTMALDAAQCEALFAALAQAQADVFYVRVPAEFGVVGRPPVC